MGVDWSGSLDRWIVHVTHLVRSVQKRDLLHLRKVTTVITKGGAVSRECCHARVASRKDISVQPFFLLKSLMCAAL